jgi:hypothetical protein
MAGAIIGAAEWLALVNVEGMAAALLIGLPIAFNLCFVLLAKRFAYPGVLRQPTGEILKRFQAGGVSLKLTWYFFMLTAILFAPVAALLGQTKAAESLAIAPIATVVGILAAGVQFLGLARWPFLVPHLARTYTDPASSDSAREASMTVFEAFHRYLGVGVGECLGYLFTGAWTILVGIAMLQSSTFDPWLGCPGIAIGTLLIIGSWEFVGHNEEHGWRFAGVLVPITYIAWSLWLTAIGVVLWVR